MDKPIIKTLEIGDRKMKFAIGGYAPRANSSILASMGDTVVLTTLTVSEGETELDYFPLYVEYIEKLYAGGIISASRFVKRERFPSTEAILKARMIDRSLRPLFPENFRHEVQIVITVLSYDEENDPVVLSIISASLATLISNVPFTGPVAGLKIGLKDDKFILNPSNGNLAESAMNFVVSGTKDKIIMLDVCAKEVPEAKISEAFDFAQTNFSKIIDFQEEIRKELGQEKIKQKEDTPNEELAKEITSGYEKEVSAVIYKKEGNVPGEKRTPSLEDIIGELAEKHKDEYSKAQIKKAVEKVVKKKVRSGILEEGKRPSGRKMDEIREVDIKLGLLPRTHGSVLFARGVTQSLSVVTLGSTRLEQTLESYEGEDTKRYMHHYNGPSYSLGEVGKFNYYPGRREIGHGALAEKALEPVIPSEEEFPYTIRVVSEILAQQGSSSMAATCGSTLALMDAGVPIKSPVAGIAIGLVTSEDPKKYILLTDVQDLEDFYGDMDFKVTGTEKGITAIQMDNKLHGIDKEILKDALTKAKNARMIVLDKIKAVLPAPRKELSQYAPKISTLKINPSKIGDLIGPGGKVIRAIIEETGVEIDVKDDGQVHIAAASTEARAKAEQRINAIVEEPEIGKIYTGKVASIKPYGVFVDVSSNISGLVHKSEISNEFVTEPSKFLKEGQEVKVRVISIDEEGRINLSIKRAQEDSSSNK